MHDGRAMAFNEVSPRLYSSVSARVRFDVRNLNAIDGSDRKWLLHDGNIARLKPV